MRTTRNLNHHQYHKLFAFFNEATDRADRIVECLNALRERIGFDDLSPQYEMIRESYEDFRTYCQTEMMYLAEDGIRLEFTQRILDFSEARIAAAMLFHKD